MNNIEKLYTSSPMPAMQHNPSVTSPWSRFKNAFVFRYALRLILILFTLEFKPWAVSQFSRAEAKKKNPRQTVGSRGDALKRRSGSVRRKWEDLAEVDFMFWSEACGGFLVTVFACYRDAEWLFEQKETVRTFVRSLGKILWHIWVIKMHGKWRL